MDSRQLVSGMTDRWEVDGEWYQGKLKRINPGNLRIKCGYLLLSSFKLLIQAMGLRYQL